MKKSSLFLLMAIGCGLVAAVMGVSYITDAKKETRVVEVTTNLPAYTEITDQDVSLVSEPMASVKSDAFKNMQDVIGKYTGMSLEQGSQLRQGELLQGADRPSGILATLPEKDLVLVSVPLQSTDLGSAIHPGDHVNLVGIIKQGNQVDVMEIKDRQVVSIDQPSKNTTAGPNLWVSVPESQSVSLQKAVVGGTIRVALLAKGEGQ